jgi:RimJ/RimL family protein N-acetyltransferase
LVLRCWEPADAAPLQRLIAGNLDHLRPWVPWAAHEPRTLPEKTREVRMWRAWFDLDQAWYWAVLGAEDGELAGAVGLNPVRDDLTVEAGGWTALARARRGYYSESMAAVTRAAFEVLGMTRVQASTEPANERSNAALRKLGFTHEATTRHLENGVRGDEMVWSILADEWERTPAADIASEARAFDSLGNRLF